MGLVPRQPRHWNCGLSTYDRTHVLKVNWLYDLPRAPVTNPARKGVLNGWQVSGIDSFVSGAPLGIWSHSADGLRIHAPAARPGKYAFTFKISLAD